jgi:flavin reductase (DIM6/NTAB) family NADH-FMN oxidoreductase RutF
MVEGPGDVFASLMHPMAIVTMSAPRERDGCLVGFHSQCSIDPSRYLVCISTQNRTFSALASARALAVHFLASSDMALARLFGGVTGDDVDKFAQCAWSPGPLGVPVLRHDGTWLAGSIVARHELGDHHAVVIDAAFGGGNPPRRQLQNTDIVQLQPGHPA